MYWKSFLRNMWEKKGYDVYTGEEFDHWVKKSSKDGDGTKRIRTDLGQDEGSAFHSNAIDHAVERILDTGRYTEKNMFVVKNPFRIAPLTALILFVTEVPCSVHITLEDGKILDERSEMGTRHRIPVYGLRAGQGNRIHLELWNESGCWYEKEIRITTGALPRCLEEQVQIRKKKRESEIPFTIVFGGSTKYPYAFDEEGEIRYYIKLKTKTFGVYRLSEGRFLYLSPEVEVPSFSNPHSALAKEMDLMGRVYREYLISDGIHHDGSEMTPGGNIITLSSSMDQYVEDTVIEIDRKTGKVVKRLFLGDILSDHPYFDYFDWAHLNTVSYQPEEKTILVCARNLHSVFKIDWEKEELIWILCDTDFWKGTPYEDKVLAPQGEIAFCYQPHAAYFLPGSEEGRKRLIIYDNHWHKRRPVESFDQDKKSYVRIYEIDENNKTVSLQNSYRTTKSKIRSNGIETKRRIFAMSGSLVKNIDGYQGRITEFDKKTGKVVNDYLTKSDFYRAYPFFADFHAFSRPMEINPEILVDRSELDDYSNNDFEPVPSEADVPEVGFQFYGDNLLVTGTDHLVQKIILHGKRHSYVKDYSHTEQNMAAVFGNMVYSMPVPTSVLLPDHYQIYIQSGGSLYDTKKTFQIAG